MIRKKWNRKTGAVNCIGRWSIKYPELVKYLGEEHFREDDPLKTHSGTERYWIFEIREDVALAFQYHDIKEELFVGSNQTLENATEMISEFIPFKFEELNGVMWQ